MKRSDQTVAGEAEPGPGSAAPSLAGNAVRSIRLIELLGSGGMGEVYLGVDERLQRRVAVKALRGDRRMDEHARARVLREARMLSSLDHPNICRLLEFIEEDDGDYLVLELVPGRDLRAYLGEIHTFAEKLRVAQGVAAALVAAHGLSVVHRDLKPENVMVTPEGEVKVLDFGLARPILDDGADAPDGRGPALNTEPGTTTLTAFGMIMGTPRSMSPEQARGEPLTAASDMYSFGLLLQELFTGCSPVDTSLPVPVMLRKAMWGETAPVEGLPAPLTALIERLKALKPQDRPSAQAAVEALRRIAEAPRRRLRALLAATMVGVLAAAATVSTVGFVNARREQRRAETAEAVALRAQGEALAVNRFVREMLASADPGGLGIDVKVVEVLDRAGAAVGPELSATPLVEAGVRETLGATYMALGQFPQAREQLERVRSLYVGELGEAAPEVLRAEAALGRLLHLEGNENDAERVLRGIMRRQISTVGPSHPDLLATMLAWAAARSTQREYQDVVDLMRRTLPRWRNTLGVDHRETLSAQDTLGRALVEWGRFDEAEQVLQDCLQRRRRTLGERHPDTLATLTALATSYTYQRRFDEAVVLRRQVAAIAPAVYGEEHPITLQAHLNLGIVLVASGRLEEAVLILEPLPEVFGRILGPGHRSSLAAMQGLGSAHLFLGSTDEALRLYRRRAAIAERELGEDHRLTLEALSNLAIVYRDLDRAGDAEAIYRRVLALRRRVFGADHLFTQRAKRNLAAALRNQGRIGEAEKLEADLSLVVIREGFSGNIYRRFPPPEPPPPDQE